VFVGIEARLPVSHCSALAAGRSLKPVCGSRASRVAELKLAVWRLGNEAIPRRLPRNTTRSMRIAAEILVQ
jgi:hypothetical protein